VTILIFIICTSVPHPFVPVEGFCDLEEYSTPAGFGLLLVCEGDALADSLMAMKVLDALDSLPASASVDLWFIGPDCAEYNEIASLCSEYGEFPAVMILVGHCGFLELDASLLVSEIVDSWYTWGDPESRMTGICNFCRRCNPEN